MYTEGHAEIPGSLDVGIFEKNNNLRNKNIENESNLSTSFTHKHTHSLTPTHTLTHTLTLTHTITHTNNARSLGVCGIILRNRSF